MFAKMKAALAAVLVVASASVALADSVDGSPLPRSDPNPPASVRGSPSILFEDRGVIGPIGWGPPMTWDEIEVSHSEGAQM